jgi:hypothetical protein
MKEGLLWFDDSTRSLAHKVALAAVAYRRKFGILPNKCYVNPSTITAPQMVGVVEVEPLATVLRCHFWVGREND